jgi:hypothetical protein
MKESGELNHILYQIDECFERLIRCRKSYLESKNLTGWDIYRTKELFRLDLNDLKSYTRALRDLLKNE